MKLPMGAETEDNGVMDYQRLLDAGKQLCMIGKDLMIAAKSMGAEDVDSMQPEEPAAQEEGEEMEASDEEDMAGEEEGPPKNAAIILAIKKKLGKK